MEILIFTLKKKKDGTFILFGLYIDDSMIVSPNLAYFEQSKAKLANEFAMANNGDFSYCLGIQVMWWKELKFILLTQDKYILDIFTQFDISDCKLVSTTKSLLELSSQKQ
jgi:hypothetical protein